MRQFKARAERSVKITNRGIAMDGAPAAAEGALSLASEPNKPAGSKQLVVDLPFLRPVFQHHQHPSKSQFARVARVALRKIVELGPLSYPDLLKIGDQGPAAIEAVADGLIKGIGCSCDDHRRFRQNARNRG